MDCATPWRKDSFFVVLALLTVAGCDNAPPPDFPDPMKGVLPAQGNEGFDLLVKAAAAVEADAGTLISRSDWTPGTRRRALQASSRGISVLKQALGKNARFAFTPYPPGQTRPSVRGWRFLGLALEWRVEDALVQGDFNTATNEALAAMRFGSILQGADASVASLGIVIATGSMNALWKALPKAGASELRSLGNRGAQIISAIPKLTTTMESEHLTMLAGVEWVLGAFRSGEIDTLSKVLGKPSSAVVRHLKELRGEDRREQVEFFEGLIQEAHDEHQALLQRASKPEFDHSDWTDPTGDRPWKRLSSALFRSGRYFFESRAKFDAELRLFCLDALLMARFKRGEEMPADLSLMPSSLRLDPFSGRDLVYIPQGSDFRLYSVGADGVDNGGQDPSAGTDADIIPRR